MDKKTFEGVVAHWQNVLRLNHWNIEVDFNQKPEGDLGILEVEPIEGRQYAILRIADKFHEKDWYWQNVCVCHELLHMPQDKLYTQIKYLTRNMSFDMRDAISNLFILETEYLTDWLSTVIVNAAGLPEKT